jgi:predicted enzyme related to lactoylglutathione lyase
VNGKICYIELPAAAPARSANFYRAVFGWSIRTRGDGALAFDDTTGQVSGTFTPHLPPAPAGAIVYVMVDDIASTCAAITANGGEIVQAMDPASPVKFARFRDPGGNVVGVYQD